MAIQLTPEFQSWLQEAAQRKASDLHLVAGEPPIYRVGSDLVRSEQDPLTAEDMRKIVYAAIGHEQADQIGTKLGDVITTCGIDGIAEGRMCITKAMDEFTMVVRMRQIWLPDSHQARLPQPLLDVALASHGLILVTGLTGSGKNTVALMLLDHINSHHPAAICTVEDPVVVHLTPKKAIIRQQSIETDTPNFMTGLRAILRLDPDVIYVSEIRDVATFQACVTAAQMGHLVIAVAHGSSPQALLQTIIDVHPEDMRSTLRRNLAEALRAVAMCCLLPHATAKGRIAAYGLLIPDQYSRETIREGRSLEGLPLPPNSQTLAQDIEHLRKEGLVTDEAARQALERITRA